MSANQNRKKIVLTPQQKAKLRGVPPEFRHCPTIDELLASGDYEEPVFNVQYFDLRRVMTTLRKAREAAGLSLADVAKRSDMDRAALNKLELGRSINPTLNTLYRYAAAVGFRLSLGCELDSENKATANGREKRAKKGRPAAKRS